jgi:hypothetical protein
MMNEIYMKILMLKNDLKIVFDVVLVVEYLN